jgi:hypothetical protein
MLKFAATTTLAAAIALAPALATADVRYTYFDVNYVSADLDNGPTIDGLGLAGSLRLTDDLHLVASYDMLSKGRLDVDTMTLGLGFNYGLTNVTDFVARAGWARVEVDIGPFDDSENGWFAQAGIRSMVTNELELNGFINYFDVGGSDTALELGAVYYLTPMIGIGVAVAISDDATVYQGGLRFAF